MRLAGGERDCQRLARREQVLLADHVGDGFRPQALGQRHERCGGRLGSEQVAGHVQCVVVATTAACDHGQPSAVVPRGCLA